MRSFARSPFVSAILAAVAMPALAQAVPPDQSCGGILCDMGVFGHKVAAAPAAAATSPAPVRAPVAVAAKPEQQVADEPEAPKVRKKKRVARAAPAKTPTPLAEISVPSAAPVRAAATAAARTPVASTPVTPPPAAPAAAAPASAAAGPADLGYLGAGLAPPKPATTLFRPIYQ